MLSVPEICRLLTLQYQPVPMWSLRLLREILMEGGGGQDLGLDFLSTPAGTAVVCFFLAVAIPSLREVRCRVLACKYALKLRAAYFSKAASGVLHAARAFNSWRFSLS